MAYPRKTQEEAINKFKEAHGDRYDYSKVVYKTCNDKVIIICKDHGEFLQKAGSHWGGNGCPNCRDWDRKKPDTQEQFLEKAKTTHGDLYDYSLVDYKHGKQKVKIICKKHGVWEQRPDQHIQGQGCPKCVWESNRLTYKELIQKSENVHGKGRYSYPNYNRQHRDTDIEIVCTEHGSFFQDIHNHLGGTGCPKCSLREKGIARRHSQDEFIERSVAVHGDKYDYSKSVFELARLPVVITCKIHGDFKQTPGEHWRGTGCPECGKTGFSSTLPGVFYVLGCGDITKVGITNRTAEHRANTISKSYGAEFYVLRSYSFDCGMKCNDIENKVLEFLRGNYSNPSSKFDGYTESFLNVDRPCLYNKIEEVIVNV